jgi:hypothetical protein
MTHNYGLSTLIRKTKCSVSGCPKIFNVRNALDQCLGQASGEFLVIFPTQLSNEFSNTFVDYLVRFLLKFLVSFAL